jgi:hypothetical protein
MSIARHVAERNVVQCEPQPALDEVAHRDARRLLVHGEGVTRGELDAGQGVQQAQGARAGRTINEFTATHALQLAGGAAPEHHERIDKHRGCELRWRLGLGMDGVGRGTRAPPQDDGPTIVGGDLESGARDQPFQRLADLVSALDHGRCRAGQRVRRGDDLHAGLTGELGDGGQRRLRR